MLRNIICKLGNVKHKLHLNNKILSVMIDNFVEDEFVSPQYNPYNKVYTHESGNHIFLGDVSAANDIQFIKTENIRLIITAAVNMDHLKYEEPIRHIIYNVMDAKTQNLSVLFGDFYELIEREIRKYSILIHCFAGISRSATLVISYIMKKNKLTFKQAISEVRKYRPTVLPNLGFQRQLKQYEKTLKMEQFSITRKLISKTSQSRKHQSKKLPEIGLPEIFALGKTLVRPKNLQPPFLIQPSSQMESRKMKMGNYEDIRAFMKEEKDIDLHFKNFQPMTNRLPIKNFRKRSISISRKVTNLYGSDHQQQADIFRIPPHRLAIQQIKFGAEKEIKSSVLRQYYN